MRILITILILLSNYAMASGTSGGTGEMEIEKIHQRECKNDADFEVTFKTAHDNPGLCTNDKTINFSCSDTNMAQKSSIALAAMLSGKKVWAWVSNCDANGQAIARTIQIIN